MEPTDAYYKAKKAFLLFVGCLFLAIFAGFKITQGEQKISILPFQLERPEFLSTILFVAVAFYLFQFSLQWAAQNAETQNNRFHRIDFIASSAIGSVAILCYFWSIASPYVSIKLDAMVRLSDIVAALLTITTAAIFASLKLQNISTKFGRWIKRDAKSADEALSEHLISPTEEWVLVFNPNAPNGIKRISFKPDGSIGLGKNDNESTWRVKNGLLEILNSQDQFFSRFSYDSKTNTFHHTNDTDTQSIRSQEIVSNKDGIIRTTTKDAA